MKLIFSLFLVILFLSLSVGASFIYASGDNDNAAFAYYNGKKVTSVSVSKDSVKFVRAKPWQVYAYHLAGSPAPTIRSLPYNYYSPSNCVFVSKTAPISYFNVKQGYVKGYFRC